MELSIRTGLPRALPARAAPPLERLGFGQVADRKAIAALCGSLRAGDEFARAGARRGLLVPASWGEYFVPEERILGLLLTIRTPPESRLAAWASAPWKDLGFPRQPGFMAPTLWQATDLAVASPGPLSRPLRRTSTGRCVPSRFVWEPRRRSPCERLTLRMSPGFSRSTRTHACAPPGGVFLEDSGPRNAAAPSRSAGSPHSRRRCRRAPRTWTSR